MELLCYLQPGWEPRIRPAQAKRAWMDQTADAFAYRCLPLNIANAHGWEILSPCGFEARWNGGSGVESVEIWPDEGCEPHQVPVSLFGHGTITFHIEAILRTSEGWNLWVGGRPNQSKDGIAPLGGVIETDWSPYTFTMNWRFTRPGHRIRFEENEPFCFIFPVQRGVLEEVQPKLIPIVDAPELKSQFEAWSASRDTFHQTMRTDPPNNPGETWQKLYYRGVNPDGTPGAEDHKPKLRLRRFMDANGKAVKLPNGGQCPAHRPSSSQAKAADRSGSDPDHAHVLAKRDWILETMEQQRSLSTKARTIHRWTGLRRQTFLDDYYAPSRPVLITGEMKDWPALQRWTPEYLKEKIGSAGVEFQGGRDGDAQFELNKHAHQRVLAFDEFIDLIFGQRSNDTYLTAFNSARNASALAPLEADLGFFDEFLSRDFAQPNGMPWIGPAGTFTPLHHDLTNNLLAQLVGRKRVLLAPPSESAKLYNNVHVFSEVQDVRDGSFDPDRFPLAAGVRSYDVLLQPGEALFIPVGWWHQVTALDFSVSITYTNFHWPNAASTSFPGR